MQADRSKGRLKLHFDELKATIVANDESHRKKSDHDLISFGIAIATIILFVGTGGVAVSRAMRAFMDRGDGLDQLLVNAVLLNIALVLLSWRRHRDLSIELVKRRQAETETRLQADTDPLTECLNRRSVGPAITRLIDDAAARGQVVAVMMLDLDGFKRVNDLNGHTMGDLILRESAARIIAELPTGSLLARLGGDEFACALAFDANQPQVPSQLAESIITAIARPIDADGISIDMTLSIGISRSDGEPICTGPHQLLHMADVAMYNSKQRGRNCASWFQQSMEQELRLRNELEIEIRRGISAGEFVPYYQQQVDITSGELTGFEMLARWNSPSLGDVSPDIFIPIAESTGAITELSEGIIRQALNDAKRWDPRLTLSVNVSPLQLRDPWFAQKLLKWLVEANFPPKRLEVEITESCLHENMGLVRSLIGSLKNQGVQISLDDFGTGYSSLSQLRSLPFDRIKIDSSFVTSLPDSKDSATIVQAINALGKGLGMPITAEGIENAEVLHALQQLGQFKGQGFYFGKPESTKDTENRLAKLGLLLAADPAEVSKPIPPSTVINQRGTG